MEIEIFLIVSIPKSKKRNWKKFLTVKDGKWTWGQRSEALTFLSKGQAEMIQELDFTPQSRKPSKIKLEKITL